jgi:hypothetical protein
MSWITFSDGGGERMSNKLLLILAVGIALAALAPGALAKGLDPMLASPVPPPESPMSTVGQPQGARLDTLWIFDATFENTSGNNAGWTALDRSGTLGQSNYWHIDTIRTPLTRPYLGDRTWWCGTYSVCWAQPRGYGNDWVQILERAFPEVDVNTNPGDQLQLEWDQRYAMERNYDYGYVDVSIDGGTTWSTVKTFNNGGVQGAGLPMNWGGANGHVIYDADALAGIPNLKLRYRFESDGAYSSQDEADNTLHSVKDGAWQLDNIKWSKGAVPVAFWTNDCEGGNEMGWQHPATPPSGQTGVTFWRGKFGVDFVTGRPFTCENQAGWMYAGVDPFSSKMVDGEDAWLISPPIDISGAQKLVAQWDMWVDLPFEASDRFDLWLSSNDLYACVTDPTSFVDESPGGWYGGPFWGTWTDNWDAFAGNDWLAILWFEQNTATPTVDHMAGIFLNRQRVGIPSGDAGTAWELDTWNSFNDWFKDQLTEASTDTALVKIVDDDGIASAFVVASNDAGVTWNSHTLLPNPDGDWFRVPPLTAEMLPGKIIRFYYTATDGVGNISTLPSNAPDGYYEMTILPVLGSTTNPAILLVDKHGRRMPSEHRDYLHTSEYYYREMLDILGYKYDKYDVEVPSGTRLSEGPDSVGMKYYDTQIWFTNEFNSFTLWRVDQTNLISWLNQSPGKERNLLLTGNDIGYEMIQAGKETLSFYETWLASDYVENTVGSVTVDSVPTLQDRAGGYNFMTYADKKCLLTGGCPAPNEFDVVDAFAGIPGTQVVADYKKLDTSTKPAGVAYTHATLGYQTVNLGFGMEFMMDSMLPGGYYKTGIADRVDLMRNIMLYFGKAPTGTPTGVVDGGFKNMLSQAYPNPFNPVTKIAYSVREAGPVTIDVYNVAGKVVRTLLDTKLEAGSSGYVAWDGTGDAGERCASGVYFYRINAPNFSETKKMIMLK